VIFKKNLTKSYEKLTTKLCKTYDKLTTTLHVSYENVKFAASDVIRETLCQRLSLVEYFELKITDNQSDLQKTYENLTTNLGGKILYENLTKSRKSGPWCSAETRNLPVQCLPWYALVSVFFL